MNNFEAPNLDAAEDSELVDFYNVCQHFRDYCQLTLRARRLRKEGLTALALHVEHRADTLYESLPEWAQW